ncbi:WD40 repeat domain-containing protein [Actinokineospora cianjurensis]|uniref:WD40 repeat domain-containing protein n=1 Tax=Actinokineospora cianjurensis TaxID=585224 RepID=UPI0011C38C4E|nr:WD40 repeat domain-containing protein [Actinokineospora cianjurensis]
MHSGFLEQVKFAVGPLTVNSRELVILCVLALFVAAFVMATATSTCLAAAKTVLARLGGSPAVPAQSRSGSPRNWKETRNSVAYLLWVILATLIVGGITGWKPIQNFSTVAVLIGIVAILQQVRAPADEFNRNLREQAGFSLLVSTFLSVHPHPLHIEIACAGIFVGLHLCRWTLRTVVGAEKGKEGWILDLIGRSRLGLALMTLLILGYACLIVYWLGPGLWHIITNWSQGAAGEVGDNLFPWVFYFPPLVIPLMIYRTWVGDDEGSGEDPTRRSRKIDDEVDRDEGDEWPTPGAPLLPADVDLLGDAGMVGAMAFSPSGELLATSEGWPSSNYSFDRDDHNVAFHLWQTSTGERVGDKVEGWWLGIPAIEFSTDGATLATAISESGDVHLWDLSDPAEPRRTGSDTPLPYSGSSRVDRVRGSALAFRKESILVATSGETTVQVWDLKLNRPVGKAVRVRRPEWELNPNPIRGLKLSAQRDLVAVQRNHRVELWNMNKGRRACRRIKGNSVAFTADGSRIAVGARGVVRIRRTRRWSRISKFHISRKFRVGALAVTKNGVLIAGDDNRIVTVWSLDSGTLIRRFALPHDGSRDRRHHSFRISRIALSPDDETVAIADYGGHVSLWSLSRLTAPNGTSAQASPA